MAVTKVVVIFVVCAFHVGKSEAPVPQYIYEPPPPPPQPYPVNSLDSVVSTGSDSTDNLQYAAPPQPPATTTPATTTTTENPEQSYTIEGEIKFKETITVKTKKKAHGDSKMTHGDFKRASSDDKRDHRHFAFIPRCCNPDYNSTHDRDFYIRRQECQTQVKNILGREVTGNITSKEELLAMNCFLQCTSRKAGLSDENGSIKNVEMTYYTSRDKKMEILGITKEMISACITTSKTNDSNGKKSSEGGNVCNMSNYEHIRFMKCMLKMENRNCPTKYQVKSEACDRYRERI